MNENENDNTEEKVIFDILIQTAGEDFILNIWWNRDFMLSLHQIYLFLKQKKRDSYFIQNQDSYGIHLFLSGYRISGLDRILWCYVV